MPSLGAETTAVQLPMIRYAQDIGWKIVSQVEACSGWVDYVEGDEEEPFWGCGECGSIWYKKAKLLKEIDAILKKFPYRKKCYRKVKGKWIPADLDKIPDDYEERIEDEPEDKSEDYVRG